LANLLVEAIPRMRQNISIFVSVPEETIIDDIFIGYNDSLSIANTRVLKMRNQYLKNILNSSIQNLKLG
jgi:hypothetical protein